MVSEASELRTLYLEHFRNRLRNRPIDKKLQNLRILKETLCQKRIDLVKLGEPTGWVMCELENVLRSLKKNKSCDPYGLNNEVFRLESIGSDLKQALLYLYNEIQIKCVIPKLLHPANIITIYKGRGCKKSLDSQRGIFIISKFRDILMKLIYNQEYQNIDSNMSDSNIGGRKFMNIRNHLFVVNGIINESIQTKSPVDLIILDYRTCFDSLWLDEAINDLFEANLQSRNLALIYEANRKNQISVITPSGPTERVSVEKIVLQGETIAPLACSVQVDTLGKECLAQEKFLFNYRGQVKVPPLSMVDDVIGIAECGSSTVELLTYLNTKTNLKKLQYGEDKCVQMHIGPKSKCCPKLSIDKWKVEQVKCASTGQFEISEDIIGKHQLKSVDDQKYLGDLLSSSGTNRLNISARKAKGLGITNQIKTILDEGYFGRFYFEAALMLREALFLNSCLLNSEVWYNITNNDIQQLEASDNNLIHSVILECPKYTPVSIMFLDLGIIPIRYILKKRRTLFLQYILKQKSDSLLHTFFMSQNEKRLKGDWASLVEQDMVELDINMTFEQIQSMSVSQFKSYVKDKTNQAAFQWLMSEKDKKKSIYHIKYDTLCLQNYFKTDLISTKQKKLLLQLRTNTVPLLANTKFLHPKQSILCPLCPRDKMKCGYTFSNRRGA